MILAGDIGGTKSLLGLFADDLRPVCSARFRSADFSGLPAMIEAFLAEAPSAEGSLHAACFGIPGPVVDNRAGTPNLAWVVDGNQIAAEIRVPVVLINDLVAMAEGIPLLEEDEVAVLQQGNPDSDGNRALIAAGTGLGMALLPRIGDRWMPVPSEGGHMDYAPRTEEEIGLLRHLRERFGRVSVERVVTGPGLYNVYQYLRDVLRLLPESSRVRERLGRDEDPARIIGESALAGPATGCGLCLRALDMFIASYGAAAGNLALLATATGGIWIGGGIAPKILPRLTSGLFLETFRAKGRFTPFLERIPVRVILNDRAALLGAARHAAAERPSARGSRRREKAG